VRSSLPAVLPDRLPDYAPGRIVVCPAERWPDLGPLDRSGIRTEIPRYGLDLRTLRVDIDPDRVRWLVERVTTRQLDQRHVHVVNHRGLLHLVDGHHALAAHLVTGSERIPVKLVRPTAYLGVRAAVEDRRDDLVGA
jgi:hypothetical protein